MKGYKVGKDAAISINYQPAERTTRPAITKPKLPAWFWFLTAIPVSFAVSQLYIIFNTL